MNFYSSLSLRFDERNLEIIDQQALPHHESWHSIDNVADMIAAIQQLKVRGAPLIGVAAALSLAHEFRRRPDPRSWEPLAEKLRASRPTAVNLMWAVDRMKKKVVEGASETEVWREALDIFEEDVELCGRIAENGATLIADGDRLLTHCNTGGLATAGVGTALGAIARSFSQGKKLHVYVDETRPLLQGGRLTTYELKKLGLPYTLICDNMAALLMAQGKVDKVIVGSDRIARNGDFANKIGTYGLAVLARYHGVKFYVAAPFTTVDLECPEGAAIPIEERKGSEVKGYGECQWAPEDSAVFNPAFDVTPAKLVNGWILDTGVYENEDFENGRFVADIQNKLKES
jgi:methylthioribose-1-phosphate isomerase